MATWDELAAALVVGEEFASRSGAIYSVASVDAKGFTAKRANGKTIRASREKVLAALARLEAGLPVAFQASPADGGVSYTVAVTVAVMHAIRGYWRADADAKVYVALAGRDAL